MHDLPQTRQSLLLALERASDEAWAEFLRIYERALVRYCAAQGLQDADARDVTQDVLAALHARLPTWDANAARGSFRAWLFRVARNIAVDAIRARNRRPVSADDSRVADEVARASAALEAERTAFDLEVRRAVFDWASGEVRREVRDVTWQSFRMTAVEGRSPEHVAATLGTTVGSVYTAKCRVVARIRERVARMADARTGVRAVDRRPGSGG